MKMSPIFITIKFYKMKKIIFAVTVLAYCLLIAITGHAQHGIEVPQPVKESFRNNFKNSEFERWVKVKNAYVATFEVGDKWRDAYFTEDGEYKGIGKYITSDLLPIFVQQTISTNYPKYEVSELYQYECMENGLSFYAVLKNDTHQVIVQLTPYGDVAFTQKTRIKQNKPSATDIAVSKTN
jgi:hypothetical protein